MQALIKENLSFDEILELHNILPGRKKLKVLQLNLGRKCNQSCIHCHVNAGPNRTETMSKEIMNHILNLLKRNRSIDIVDLTGGAPELNLNFRYIVKELRSMKKRIIVRSNLTVFFEEGQTNLPEFLAGNQVEIVASLPCYIKKNVDRQRGANVYEKSIHALKILNSLGYGKKDSKILLDLVYNPVGACLPPEQKNLERDYKLFLKNKYGIEFNKLLTMTNMPINRFARELSSEGGFADYCNLLVENFNPKAAPHIMCREMLSVGWNGELYDCDFNQALGIPLKKKSKTVRDIADFSEADSEISFGSHCFGCTAGSGSSCRGALL